MTIRVDHSLNLLGVRCPDFIESVRNYVRTQCEAGQVIHVAADEPSAARDVTRLCEFLGHELLHAQADPNATQFFIRKG